MFGMRAACIALLLITHAMGFAATVEDDAPSATSARAYVEASQIIVPRRAGEFTLEQSIYDPAKKYSGAGFRYTLPEHQETRIDVYVYPAGKLDRTTALTAGMEGFRVDIQRALDAGIYNNLRFDEDQAFALTEPAAAPAPTGKDARDRDGDIAGVLATLLQADRPAGRKLSMTLNLQPQDWPMYSVGYLFYKNLYYIKVRATAAQSRIRADAFHALTDKAVRSLVPTIEVANIGDCANSVIHVDSNAAAEAIAKMLVMQSAEHQTYNCHQDADAAGVAGESTDSEIVVITFEPGEWTSK